MSRPGAASSSRADIARAARLIDEPNHFVVLGVEPETDIEDVKARYKALSRKWHVDAFGGQGLTETEQAQVDAVFKRLAQAWEVLSDPGQRAEHLIFLERRRAGLSNDIHSVLRAETLVDEGLVDLGRKRYADARAKLEEAAGLNPDDPLIRAHLAWASYRAQQGSAAAAKAAQDELQRAVETQENLPDAYRYLGTIAFEQGELEKAARWLKRCIEWAPKDVDAARLLRLARSRKEKQKPTSGFSALVSKLFGK